MTRTSPDKVREILETDLSTSALLTWIDVASIDIDEVVDAGTDLSPSELKTLETLWAAHKATTQDPRIQSASRQSGKVDYGERRSYREMALAMDDTGTLGNQHKPTADVEAFGTREDD